MARKTQEEINYWFQEHTIKSGRDLSLIEKILHINNLDTPNNIIIHKNGLIYDDFARWYCDEVEECIYPKTYVECCEILNYKTTDYDAYGILVYGYMCDTLTNFQKLLICRDAYWKIAGEQMGLGKPWEPAWDGVKLITKYAIFDHPIEGWVRTTTTLYKRVLVFPTPEMRDEFYENFKNLIESCKELL